MMDKEEFIQQFQSARYHDELPAVITYRTPENKPWRYVAMEYRFQGLNGVVLLYPGHSPLEILLSDILEVV